VKVVTVCFAWLLPVRLAGRIVPRFLVVVFVCAVLITAGGALA